MKDLIIPNNNSKDSINIANINNGFRGIIIAYKNDKPVQYIVANNDEWQSSDYIDYTANIQGHVRYSLLDLCNQLINNHIVTNFKVIEFE